MNIVPPKYKIRLMRQINAYYVNLKQPHTYYSNLTSIIQTAHLLFQPHTYYSNLTPIIPTARLLIIGESFKPKQSF